MKHLKIIKKKNSGRDVAGHVVVRHRGGEHKRYYRVIDLKRDKVGIEGKVIALEYDPNRTVDLALVQYADGEKRYILAPEGLHIGDKVLSGKNLDTRIGYAMSLSDMPVGTVIHNIELTPGRGGQMARSAGTGAIVMAKEGNMAHLKMPSGEIRKVNILSMATVGQLGNIEWKNEVIGKAGRSRHMGRRPKVRGVAQNPRSHPHGGGEGRSPIGLKFPKTWVGKKAVGKTRKKKKYSNKYIVQRRKGGNA